MRKVIYYCGGTVVDFNVEEAHYEDFLRSLRNEKYNNDKELNRARWVLAAYVRRDTNEIPGPLEQIAACYVWHYFNTHVMDDHRIDGDIMIVDLDGTGATIEYTAAQDVQLEQM
ncbi:hypothetical protein RIEGSTA812A_PEG_517 [invertebrate metagenome]|uniref:Uncharacterized protein n=1 Tax=invertebrate metagenome TaxID=1711999 RepID=A0A484H687_9ZZZZ